MCTSFYLDLDRQFVRELKEKMERSSLTSRFEVLGKKVKTSGDIRPSDIVPVIAPDRNGKRSLFPMKWGFSLHDGRLIVNARSETAAEKQLFRESWVAHRCIIPSSWYYEWEHYTDATGKKRTGQKYRIGNKDGSPVYLCGLYRIEEGIPVFAVLTRKPEGELIRIHDRMPLILGGKDVEKWIYPSTDPESVTVNAVTDLRAEAT